MMTSTCCTCVVSFVVRVISEAVPNGVELVQREVLDMREELPADDPAEAERDLCGEKRAATAQPVPAMVSSMMPPMRRM